MMHVSQVKTPGSNGHVDLFLKYIFENSYASLACELIILNLLNFRLHFC